MNTGHLYPWIRHWGRFMGSKSYYWKEQQRQAAADNAPLDAIYRRSDGGWATLSDLVPSALEKLKAMAEKG